MADGRTDDVELVDFRQHQKRLGSPRRRPSAFQVPPTVGHSIFSGPDHKRALEVQGAGGFPDPGVWAGLLHQLLSALCNLFGDHPPYVFLCDDRYL